MMTIMVSVVNQVMKLSKVIHFQDSEEERMHDFDEHFDNEFSFRLDESDKRRKDADGVTTNEPPNLSFAIEEMEKEHAIEEDYMTDVLDSGTYEDSCKDKHVVIRYNEEEEMTKDFTFKFGMKFSSLKQFKKAILEYNVLNGMKVRFSKNDAKRHRVVCKHKMHCNYIVLCNRVLRSTTYKVKTLFEKHKCGRQFFNKNVKIDWVAKMIVDKLKNNNKMKLNEVVICKVKVVDITGCRTFKSRKPVRKIVERGSSKQYSLLWSYV